jgi:hypothetical protein
MKLHWVIICVAAVVAVLALFWLFGPVAGAGGALAGIGTWLFGRKTRPSKEEAQARLDDAVELGRRRIADAEQEAEKKVKEEMDEHPSLADYLNDRTGND